MESDSDSSDCSESEVIFTPPNKVNKSSVADLLRASLPQQSNMTSLESMAAQLATIASLNGFPPIYPGKCGNTHTHIHTHMSSIWLFTMLELVPIAYGNSFDEHDPSIVHILTISNFD